MKLTDTQIQSFHAQGYHILGDLQSPAEADRMAQIYLDCVANHQSTHDTQRVNKRIRHSDDGGRPLTFYQLRCAHLMHPEFDALIRHPHLLDAVESLIGPNLRIVVCQGMYKPPHTGDAIQWHQDDYYFRVDKPNAVVSCWLTFDDATVDSGCMWVIPGAHQRMVEHQRTLGGPGGYCIPDIDERNAVPVELKRGQCMLHHGLMPHRTLANTTAAHRRALAIHYMDATTKPSQPRQQEPPENLPMVRGKGVEW